VSAPARRTEGGDRFSHQTVAVLEAFATSVLGLHEALRLIQAYDDANPYWDECAADWARGAVRCARLLAIKEDYR